MTTNINITQTWWRLLSAVGSTLITLVVWLGYMALCMVGEVILGIVKFIFGIIISILSMVEGKKKGEFHPLDLVSSFLPAGTLSGAPKIRAMEIIDELESVRRGLYGGATGYIDFSGDMDFCITIRTMIKKKNRVYLQAGAGIVADSVPENEYQECCNKVMALAKTLIEEENL